MTSVVLPFLLANIVAILLVPRRLAPLPLLIVACYLPRYGLIELGPFHFSVFRLIIATWIVRMIVRSERLDGFNNGMDKLLFVWGGWILLSSAFHGDRGSALVYRLGLVYDSCGTYFLVRVSCRSFEDAIVLCRGIALVLLPVAIEMGYEKITVQNVFHMVLEASRGIEVRDGKVRAMGPFAHSILAGTLGAVTIPLMAPLWRRHWKTALIGIVACLVMIVTSASSGPVLSAMAAIGALLLWRLRYQVPMLRWLILITYIILDLLMKVPAYYIMARIDLVGGSTGWHRARLIESAFEHLPEWWLAGTDNTRHWMPTGVSWSTQHTDITNHYLQLGVVGGIPLMVIFIIFLASAFSFVGRMVAFTELSMEKRFLCWAIGASLFAHAVSWISVAYFDQSIVFPYLSFAMIGSLWSSNSAKHKV